MWDSDAYVLDAALRVFGDMFSREGRRNLAKGFLVLLSAALVMIAILYLVYGRGPQCVVRAEKARPHLHHFRHWYWPFEDPQLWLRTSAEVQKQAPNCR
ncbi:hypothetical protein ACUXST_001469 [Sphingomonas sp. F9_3S_D5_B_2]